MPDTLYFTASIDGLRELLEKLSPARGREALAAAAKAMRQGAILIEGEAKRLCVVDTGNLRGSITHSEPYVNSGVLVIDVGTNVEYAPFVEFGTGKRGAQGEIEGPNPIYESARKAMAAMGYVYGGGTKRPGSVGMAARPFLFPAFEKHRERFFDMVTRAVLRVITGGQVS